MEYFLGHVKYILMAGVFIAVVSSVWALAAIKWQKDKSKSGEKDPPACEGCAGCGMMNRCGKDRDLSA